MNSRPSLHSPNSCKPPHGVQYRKSYSAIRSYPPWFPFKQAMQATVERLTLSRVLVSQDSPVARRSGVGEGDRESGPDSVINDNWKDRNKSNGWRERRGGSWSVERARNVVERGGERWQCEWYVGN